MQEQAWLNNMVIENEKNEKNLLFPNICCITQVDMVRVVQTDPTGDQNIDYQSSHQHASAYHVSMHQYKSVHTNLTNLQDGYGTRNGKPYWESKSL